MPPSCQAGDAGVDTCGPGGTDSCCTSLLVPGGTYYRTYYYNSGSGPTGEADPATVSTFLLDEYLVTVGRFRSFVGAWNDGLGYTPPFESGKHSYLNSGDGLNATGGGYEPGWDTADNVQIQPTPANLGCGYGTWSGGDDRRPINCVNWYEAYAFCIWDGGFLPSEAEWEYAAAGGSDQRQWPWGNPGDAGIDNQHAIYDCNYPLMPGTCTNVSNVAPVGAAPLGAGKWGQLDLLGDLRVWNLDWYESPYASAACTDCADVTTASGRVTRGDAYYTTPLLNAVFRNAEPPGQRRNDVGFRCARPPP